MPIRNKWRTLSPRKQLLIAFIIVAGFAMLIAVIDVLLDHFR